MDANEISQADRDAIHKIMAREGKTYWQAYEIVKANKLKGDTRDFSTRKRISGEIHIFDKSLGMQSEIFQSNN
jgi:hypothetical protein